MKIHQDCYHYLGYKPCKFHKRDGRLCEGCNDYKKIEKYILIIKLNAIGDVLRTTSILPAINNRYPNSAITWITRSNAVPLIKNNPFVFKSFSIEDNYLEFILSREFDMCINLDAEPLSGSIAKIVKAREKVGFIVDKRGALVPANDSSIEWFEMGVNDHLKRVNRKTYFEHMYEIIGLPMANIYPPQYNLTDRQKAFAMHKKQEFGLHKFRKTLGINTGGGKRWEYKKWLKKYYIKLIELVYSKYPDIGIILYGGPEEVKFNNKIIQIVGNKVINSGCMNSIEDFVSLVNLSDIFLTSDSLGMQISISQRKNTIVLVGPTSPWELDVFGKGEIIYPQVECIACYLARCDKKPYCMELISPEMVMRKIEKYL